MFKARLGILALALAVLFGLGLFAGFFLPRLIALNSSPKIFSTTALLQQVQTLSQLVTVKYVIEKVIVLEDVKWFGESRVLMVAHGEVKAGVDLSQLEPGDLQVNGKRVVLRLPPARITDAYLDDKQTRVIERTTGMLRAFDKDLEQTARQQAVDDIRRGARVGGILKDADERARTQLRSLFQQMGFEVEFQHP